MSSNKKGVILFITILLLIFMSSIVFIFLKDKDLIQKEIKKEQASLQSNIAIRDLIQYLKNFDFKEEDIFFLSDMDIPIVFGDNTILINIISNQSKLNLNLMLDQFIKDELDSAEYYRFLDKLTDLNMQDAEYFINILVDTYDKDDIPISPRGDSELINDIPRFQNGNLVSYRQLEDIYTYYKYKAQDNEASRAYEFIKNNFSFSNQTVDINFANKEILMLIFPDEPEQTLQDIIDSMTAYESFDDYPISDESKFETNSTKILGNSFNFNSTSLTLEITIQGSFFETMVAVEYDLKTKKSRNITIDYINITDE